MSQPTRQLKLGRRAPKNAPALRLAPLLTGVLPDHPAAADFLNIGGWQMLGNDRYGDCVAVTWANVRRLLTRQAGRENYPALASVIDFYRTQNPNFPSDDNGMVIQTALEDLANTGGPDGVKAIAFAKVDHTRPDEVKAAIAIFGYVWVGINVQSAQMDQFSAGQPWDYVPSSQNDGGHSIIVGGYDSDGTGGDERFVTWAKETSFTDSFWSHLVEEAWVVVFPEHLTSKPFQDGVDLTKLASAYQQITGRQLPVPTPPGPSPVPTPVPDPGAAPFPGADPAVAARVAKAAAHAKLSPSAWLNKHLRSYFDITASSEPQEASMSKGGKSKHDQHDRDRDNASGRFVSDEYADENPATTTSESTLTKTGGDRQVERDDATGQFVAEEYAKGHPDTTSEDHV